MLDLSSDSQVMALLVQAGVVTDHDSDRVDILLLALNGPGRLNLLTLISPGQQMSNDHLLEPICGQLLVQRHVHERFHATVNRVAIVVRFLDCLYVLQFLNFHDIVLLIQ